ncbi:MAG: DUF3788 domain-containing protein [Candidatus Aminicenantes bacterium]|nr:DUF3788 domain-containing protein [Candidatus Aminicenantes bacterium]
MSASIFDDKSIEPNEKMLSEVLGNTYKLWQEIQKHLQSEYGDLVEEWKYYGQKSGWLKKTLKKKRNLFFFTPFKNYFRITFVFGARAVAEVEKSDLPESIKETLKNARKYAEGRGLSIEVKFPEDVQNIIKLVAIKVNN